jgi:16S rRNA (cytidine1402-2'-O)-methyltransferase
MGGRLVLAGVPLGNPGDASDRLRAALGAADVVAAEDTRKLRRLVADIGVEVPGRVVSYFDGNEERRTPELLALIADGHTVVLVTDGGMPTVSDPGYRLAAAVVAASGEVSVLPGPSAVTAALAVSGLPAARFCFEGFLPRKPGERRRLLAELASDRRTVVFFESPRRLATTLLDAASAFGPDRLAAVCRELTKTYEEVRRGGLAELAQWAVGNDVRGEITVVVAGAAEVPAAVDPGALVAAVATAVARGASRKDAITEVARATGVPRRLVYDAAHRDPSRMV